MSITLRFFPGSTLLIWRHDVVVITSLGVRNYLRCLLLSTVLVILTTERIRENGISTLVGERCSRLLVISIERSAISCTLILTSSSIRTSATSRPIEVGELPLLKVFLLENHVLAQDLEA